jgi:hypothetical protein
MKTSMRTNSADKNSDVRGSSLIVVMMCCVALLIVIASYLRYSSTQATISSRATLLGEARGAAEGAAEYALGEMTRRAAANPSFGAAGDPLAGYTMPSADRTYLAPGTGNNHVVAAQVDFKAGAFLGAGVMTLIDPNDTINSSDDNKGTTLTVRNMKIFGKAAVRDPKSNGLLASYISETIQVREQAWFNYAIFFNMDMEFHAGTDVEVFGPVWTNANAYIVASNSHTLKFYSNLTAVKKILREVKYDGGTTGFTGDVSCIKAAGMNATDLVLMGTSQDSDTTAVGGFRTLANTRWKDFVQDQSYPLLPFNPPGLPGYVPDDLSTSSTNELRNNAYSMIEPQLSTRTTDGNYGRKAIDRENLKFSALSGFVIEVSLPASVGAQPQWKLRIYQAADTTHPLSADNLPDRTGQADGTPISVFIDPFNDQDAGPADNGVSSRGPGYTLIAGTTLPATWKIKRALKIALLDAIVSVPYNDAGSSGWGDGFSALTAFTPAAPATDPSTFTPAVTYYPVYDRREGYIYPNSASSNTNALKGAMHALRIDMGKLNALINNSSLWLKPDGTAGVYNVATNYSGVVYVQFPLATIDTSRFPSPAGSTADGDMIRPAQAATTTTPGYALVLTNARVLPQLLSGTPDGFTIATNGPVYVAGHYNADGNSATGSATTPDVASGGTEVPAMIAGDSVTILSPGYNFRDMATNERNSSGFTEVSAAIVTGLVPTRPGVNDIWAGGVHNFARFHENWGGITYRYRGSLAALFECEVTKAPFRQGYYTYWYDPPDRDVGYHAYLAAGRFPPGTPVKRTVRRMNFEDITAAAYTTGP